MSPHVLSCVMGLVWLASCSGHPIDLPITPSPFPSLTLSEETGEPPAEPDPEQTPPVDSPEAPPSPLPVPRQAILLGAGDIALCNAIDRATTTAQLLQSQLAQTGSIAITLGDNSNDDGRPSEYANCFGSTWGRFDVRPSPGNHDDYDDKRGHGGAAYFAFFGPRAGPPGLGYYSFPAGPWHVISLNSEIMTRGPHEEAQLDWLRADLREHAGSQCILAYFHRPMVSSGDFAAQRMIRLWHVLYAAGTDVIVNGHEHFYERFAPQTPMRTPDAAYGIRQFIVGTGGAQFHRAGPRAPNSEKVIQETLGIIRFTLRASDYDWQFLDARGAVADAGTGSCHGRPLRS